MPEGNAGMGGYNFHRQVLVRNIRAYLLPCPETGENGHGRGEGYKPRLGKACGNAEHVLLRYSNVEKPVGEGIRKANYSGRLSQIRRQPNDFIIVLAHLRQS